MLTNLRKRTALLASLAVVCATVALVPQSANATASVVPNLGTPLSTPADPYTAPDGTTTNRTCPGTSAAAAGFTDTTATDVDCIKMYGITTGKTATTYDPSGTISRQDMARFIQRMFVPTGMAAAGATAVPAFTDTAHVTADGLAAISAIASHGITTGTTATTFSPDDLVTRDQMALFMYRFAQKVRPYDNSAAVSPGLTMTLSATGGDYNYSDIATQSFEAMEAIIGLYNLGALGEACVALTASTCGTTYRPTENITRLEMAQMLVGVLNHTNARPAGVTIQTTSAVTATTEATSISYRNAAFEPVAAVFVDNFGQVRNDTSAATKAISVPFVAILNTASSSGTGGVTTTGGGTLGTVDTADKITNTKGNVAGMPLTLTSPSTGRWWVHASPQGTIYVDGTTVGFLFEASVAAGAGTTFATHATHGWDMSQALVTNFGGSIDNVTSTIGSYTYQGTSRTLTTTLTGSTAAAVVDGYTVKYVDKVVNYGGGTSNQTVSFVTSYAASSSGVVTATFTCAADPLPLASNLIRGGALDYYESHEITLTFATSAATNGWPTGGSDPTDAGVTAPALSCDDMPRLYTAGSTGETITVGKNYADVSTAGTLATITATAFDQYGLGVSGVTAGFRSTTVTNVARTAAASVGPTARSVLTTGTDGTASLTAVVCTANGSVAWSIETDDGVMDDTAASVPAAGVVEGSTIYCTTAGADGVTATTATSNVTNVAEVQTLTFYNDGVAANPSANTFVLTYDGEVADASAHGASNTDIATDLNDNVNIPNAVTVAIDGGGTFLTVTFAADTGTHPLITCTGATMYSGTDGTCTAARTTVGKHPTTFDFIDNDLSDNSIVTVRTVKNRVATTNAKVVETWYQRWTYDSGDNLALGAANPAATEAEFEAGLAVVANLTTDATVTYRTGATTTGVSYVSVG